MKLDKEQRVELTKALMSAFVIQNNLKIMLSGELDETLVQVGVNKVTISNKQKADNKSFYAFCPLPPYFCLHVLDPTNLNTNIQDITLRFGNYTCEFASETKGQIFKVVSILWSSPSKLDSALLQVEQLP